MLNKIFHTFITRALVSLLNFLIVIVTARYLGADIRGIIALLMLSVTIITIVNNVIGGSALVYLVPRNPLFRLLVPSYLWAVLSSVVISLVFLALNLVEIKYFNDLMILSLLASIGGINVNIMLGMEKIRMNNLITLLQSLILFLSLILIVFVFNNKTFHAYLFALYLAYGLTFIISILWIAGKLKMSSLKEINVLMRDFLKLGFQIQLAYILQLMNYRFSYFLLDNLYGKAQVGVYSVGISVAEAVWLISRSIAMVQYARISNTSDKTESRKLTLALVKLSFFGTILLLLPVLFFPAQGYAFIFGSPFSNISEIILWLSPGIIALAVSTVFTHYFSGNAMNLINTIASGIGFLFTIIFCILLVPRLGIKGAALSASISYSASLVYLYLMFKKESHLKWGDFMPGREDYIRIRREVKNIFNPK